jgi:protein-S-isoprenylcysteine O-methyltransferase Ste14
LPFSVVIVVPFLIIITLSSYDSRWGLSRIIWLPIIIGMIIFASGLVLNLWCIKLFFQIGKGTLMPWEPAKNMVVDGPYRYVRNPMICGVILMLIGITVGWGSRIVGFWTMIAFLISHFYFILSEEHGLEKRFGEKYRRYKANVPRWIPRIAPWEERQ